MRHSRIGHEVRTSPRVAAEEVVWQKIALESVARDTRGDEVAWRVCSAARYRKDVVQRGEIILEPNRTVDTPPATIAKSRALECALVLRGQYEWMGVGAPARDVALRTWEHHAVAGPS